MKRTLHEICRLISSIILYNLNDFNNQDYETINEKKNFSNDEVNEKK